MYVNKKPFLMNISSFDDIHGNATLDKQYHWSSNPENEGSIPSRKALGVAFFATGPGLGLIMYVFTTLEFPTYNFDFHLLTTSMHAKYYYNTH